MLWRNPLLEILQKLTAFCRSKASSRQSKCQLLVGLKPPREECGLACTNTSNEIKLMRLTFEPNNNTVAGIHPPYPLSAETFLEPTGPAPTATAPVVAFALVNFHISIIM